MEVPKCGASTFMHYGEVHQRPKEDTRGHMGTGGDSCQLSPFPWLSCLWVSFFFIRN